MSKSISFQHGTKLSREHNIRNAKYIKNQEHINKGRIDQNIIFIDEKLQDAYEEIFGESFQEYNSKLRKDRQCKSYYDKIKNDSQKHLVYECIVQIGNEEDTSYTSELEQQALIQFFMKWKERNPNLKLVGAYMHNDEATSHLHLDYIPVATECERGMKTQNALKKALQQQGFNGKGANNTEQMQWQNSERKALEKICQKLGIDARANQGLCKTKYFDAKTGEIKVGTRKHLSVEEYKQAREEMLSDVQQENSELHQENSKLQQEISKLQSEVEELQVKKISTEEMLSDIEKQKEQINEDLQPLRQEQEKLTVNIAKSKARIDKLNKEIKRKTDVLNIPKAEIPEIPETVVVKGAFGKEKTRPLNEEERKLKQQEIDNIRKQNELVELQNLLRERELTIQEQERKQKARLQRQNAELEQISNDINSLQTERANLQSDINSLQTEQANLQANIADIKADAVNNALVNVNVLNAYYVNSDAYMTRFRAYNDTIEKGDKQYAKNNKNAEYGDNS